MPRKGTGKGHLTKHGVRLDLMLELFMLVRDPRKAYPRYAIAAFCGCTPEALRHGEVSGLAKMQARARRQGIEPPPRHERERARKKQYACQQENYRRVARN